jgi:glycosyltransferase involved in cell wall biosynthesis
MKILILNRRDIANPAGGGAELYTHEIARGLTGKYGCEIVIFSNRYPGSTAEEVIDGVRYVRKGSEITVHMWGFLYAIKRRKYFDYIIDEINGPGFFTFFLPNAIILIHQMYREYWIRELGAKGVIPYVLESMFLRCYRRKLAITVSRSTKDDLERVGFRDVKIVMNAIDKSYSGAIEKAPEPTLVFLGRLKITKQPEQAIEIFRKVKMSIPDARLWIIGGGTREDFMKKRAEGLEDVTFCGRVSEHEKFSFLRRAHVLLVPSIREGFGINVIEAASAGCPAIGYNVPGLRDSIRDGETGYLVDTPDEAATRIIELLEDGALYQRMSHNCIEYVEDFVWEKRVDEFWSVINSSGE